MTVIKTTDGSVFTGLTSALIEGKRHLYVANVSKGRVDVYDNMFHFVDLDQRNNNRGDVNFGNDQHSTGGKPFEDPQLPDDYVPFNVATIGNDIVVTYVLDPPGQQLPTAGPGFGYRGHFKLHRPDLLQRLTTLLLAECALGIGSGSARLWAF